MKIGEGEEEPFWRRASSSSPNPTPSISQDFLWIDAGTGGARADGPASVSLFCVRGKGGKSEENPLTAASP